MSSFHLKIICCSSNWNVFHWPWGPSIFKPAWSTGQMPECSSGIRGSPVNSESVSLSVKKEVRTKRREKERKRGAQISARHRAVPPAAAGLFLSPGPIRDLKAYHDGSEYIYLQHTKQKRRMRLCVQKPTSSKLIVRMMFVTPKVQIKTTCE